MDIQTALMLIGLIVVILLWAGVPQLFPRFKIPKGTHLDPNAKIVDVTTKSVGSYRNRSLKTTVTFSDGTVYSTHDSEGEPHFGYTTLYVDAQVKESIKKKAQLAHDKKCGVVARKTINNPVGEKNYMQNEKDPYPSNLDKEITLCGNCGARINSGAVFCEKCGAKVSPERAQYCRFCGQLLDDDAQFCSSCGHKI